MSILDKIRDWFESDHAAQGPPLPRQGQQEYHGQTVPVETQAQESLIELKPLSVEVAGIVPVWSMPSKHQVLRQSQQGALMPQDLMDGDYKYKRVTIWLTGFNFSSGNTGMYIGDAKDLIGNVSGGSIWGVEVPVFHPIVLEGLTHKLSFCQTQASLTANGPMQLSYVAERWAD